MNPFTVTLVPRTWIALATAVALALGIGGAAAVAQVGDGGALNDAGRPRTALERADSAPINALSYQGRLTNPAGQPVTSTVTVRIELLSITSTVLYSTSNKSVTPDTNGLFTVAIGDAADPHLVRAGVLQDAASVRVSINGTPLTPNQPINSLVGFSVAGTGVVGRSVEALGVSGLSAGASGSGVKGEATGSDGWGVHGVSTSSYGMVGESISGTGLLAKSNATNGFGLQVDGHAKQDVTKSGIAKAHFNTVTAACYNSNQTGSDVATPYCGFQYNLPQTNSHKINFGFNVATRFIQVTPVLTGSNPAIAQVAGFPDGGNSVLINTWVFDNGTFVPSYVNVLVTVH